MDELRCSATRYRRASTLGRVRTGLSSRTRPVFSSQSEPYRRPHNVPLFSNGRIQKATEPDGHAKSTSAAIALARAKGNWGLSGSKPNDGGNPRVRPSNSMSAAVNANAQQKAI